MTLEVVVLVAVLWVLEVLVVEEVLEEVKVLESEYQEELDQDLVLEVV